MLRGPLEHALRLDELVGIALHDEPRAIGGLDIADVDEPHGRRDGDEERGVARAPRRATPPRRRRRSPASQRRAPGQRSRPSAMTASASSLSPDAVGETAGACPDAAKVEADGRRAELLEGARERMHDFVGAGCRRRADADGR